MARERNKRSAKRTSLSTIVARSRLKIWNADGFHRFKTRSEPSIPNRPLKFPVSILAAWPLLVMVKQTLEKKGSKVVGVEKACLVEGRRELEGEIQACREAGKEVAVRLV